MEVLKYELSYGRSDEFKLYDLSDLHSGTEHCNEDAFKAKVREIAQNKYARWLGGGDMGECITPKDKRWDGRGISSWMDIDDIGMSQENRIESLLRPIKSQGIGMIEGNHEDSMRIHNNFDMHKHLCERLELPNLGMTCFIDLWFKRKGSTESHVIRCVAAHGSGGAITKSAKTIRLKNFMDSFAARIYMHSHVHDTITLTVPYLDLTDNGRIISRNKVGAMTGCWFTSYTQGVSPSYAEKKCFPPSVLGCPSFIIVPDKDVVEVRG